MEILNSDLSDIEKIKRLELLPQLKITIGDLPLQSAEIFKYLKTRINIYSSDLIKLIKRTKNDKETIRDIVKACNPWNSNGFNSIERVRLCKEYDIKLVDILPQLLDSNFGVIKYLFTELNYKIDSENLSWIRSDKVLHLAIDHSIASNSELLEYATLRGYKKSVEKLVSLGTKLTETNKCNLIKLCDKKLLKKYKIDYRLHHIEPDDDNAINFKIINTYGIDPIPFVEKIKEYALLEELQILIELNYIITADDVDAYYDRICQHGRCSENGRNARELLLFAISNNLELNCFTLNDLEIECDYMHEYEAELQLYYDFIKGKQSVIISEFIIPDLSKLIVDFL
jgi:hypothetical protein